MLIFESKLNRKSVSMMLVLIALAGCAGQQLHSSGVRLVQEGRVEEGLAKLEQATKVAPDNLTYHKDLLRSKEQIANRLLTNASSEQASGHLDAAQALYERILKIDPNNHNAKIALETILMDKRHEALILESRDFFTKGNLDAARSSLKPVLLESPKNDQAVALLRQIDEQETKVNISEPMLNSQFKKPVTLQFRDANLKMVFEALSRSSGINILLDKDIKADLKTSIFVKDVSVDDAIDLILMQSQLEKKTLSNNTLYIYPNTPAKLKDFQDLKIRSFHLVNADAKQILTLIKTMLKTKDIFVHEKTNSIVMRDTPDAIHLAEKLIADQDIAEPEVMLEVEVLEIDRARASDIGIQFPNSLSLSPIAAPVAAAGAQLAVGTTAVAATTTNQLTIESLRSINGGKLGVNIPTFTINALLQDSDTNILSSPRLRVRNRDKAKIMIGDRVPIITNSLTPQTSGAPVVTGTVTYQDVGLKLDVEPEIHLDNQVSIKIGLEVSSLGNAVTNSATGSIVYTVQTRNTSTSLSLRDGETQILAGLIEDKDTRSVDKVPALGQIPILGHLFSNSNGNKSKKEIILSITPHIVGNAKLAEARELEYWSGTESELKSTQLVLKPLGTVSLSGAAPASGSRQPAAPASAPTPVPAPLSAPAPAPASLPTPAVVPVPVSAIQKTQTEKEKVISEKDKTSLPPHPMTLSWRGPKQAKVGDKITLSLSADTTQGAKSITFHAGFDPAVLKAIDVIEGDALRRNNARSTLAKNIDQAGGDVSVELSGTGSTGSANIATMIFEVISPEGGSVTINSITATGANGESETPTVPQPFEIPATP